MGGEGDSREGQMRAIDDRRREGAMCMQATSAPVGALPSAAEISAQRAACATMPAAIGNALSFA